VAIWAYSAINAQGAATAGELNAPTLDAAREQLRLRGLLPERLVEAGAAGEGSAGDRFKRVRPKALQIFSRQFATMIAAGLNVVASLVILEEQTEDPNLAAVVAKLRSDVEGGMLLSEAMARHPKVFSRLYVSLVEAGEAAGILDDVLDRAAQQLEKEMKIKRRVKSAMIYPSLVLTFAIVTLIGMLMFLVPVFEDIFKSLGGQLPLMTRMVLAASHFLQARWYVLFPALALLAYGVRRGKRTEQGRQLWDKVKLKLPMKVGDVVLKVTLARLTRTLATMVAAGVDIIKALEITGTTSGNWVIEEALSEVRARVNEGVPIAQPLMEHPVFPPMVGHMVKVGEETGELERMLQKIADFYEDEVDAAIGALTSIIEPVMMIFVGALVGVIILSMYLPMFKMLSLVK
jgi:type IV pilus assembly protein PilC